jgi:hypothetical protein
VSIKPQNSAPVSTGVTKSSGGVLGLTKTWTINGTGLPGNVPTDADGDTITYAVTSLPSGGLLNVPVITGNVVTLITIGTEAGKQFVVTMSDGHGGNVPITLTI